LNPWVGHFHYFCEDFQDYELLVVMIQDYELLRAA